MKKLLKLFSLAPLLLAPLVALASSHTACATITGLSGVLCRLNEFLGNLLPFLVALGVVYLTWGVVQYFIGETDEAKKKGRDRIIYGIIGLAVIVSIWGLVALLTSTFGVGSDSAPQLVNLAPTQGGGSGGGGCNLISNPKLQNLLGYVVCLINDSVIPFIFAIAVIMFVWGAVKYLIIGGGEEKKRDEGKQLMLWGIIALAAMVSIWGLVKILGATFGLSTNLLPEVKP